MGKRDKFLKLANELIKDMVKLKWGSNVCDLIEFNNLRNAGVPEDVCRKAWKDYKAYDRELGEEEFDVTFFLKSVDGERHPIADSFQLDIFDLDDLLPSISIYNQGTLPIFIDGKEFKYIGFTLNGEERYLVEIATGNNSPQVIIGFQHRYDIYIHYGDTCWNKGWQQTKEYCMSEIEMMAKDPEMAGHIIELYDLDEEEPVVRIVL